MNPETEETIESLQQKGQELATTAQEKSTDLLADLEAKIRSNPWAFIGGAVAVGVVVAALLPKPRPEPEKLEAVRDWLREAYDGLSSRVPDRSDMQSAVDSLDLPGRLDRLRKKLHLS